MLVKFALRNLGRNRRRSMIAISTIAFGMTGILFLDGFFTGLLDMHADNAIRSRYGHGQVMTKGYWDAPQAKPWENWIENSESIKKGLEGVPGVSGVYPRLSFHALLSNGVSNIAGKGQGVDGSTEKHFFNKMNFVSGHEIGDESDGMVLGIGLAKALNVATGDRVTIIGRTIHGTVNAVDLYVTGIFHIGMKEADDMLFQIPLAQAQTLMDTTLVESLSIGLDAEKHWPAVASYVNKNHSDLEALDVYTLDEAWALNGKLFLTALMNVFKLIFLGVIILSIYNSASNTVMERKREIGMLRANGESAREILTLIVFEGIALALIGALMSVFFITVIDLATQSGITMPPTPGTNRALPVPLTLDFVSIIGIAVLGIGACVLATGFSALQVTKMSIVTAIRSPS